MPKNISRKAFTLVEVLVTIIVIGIVAALIIPQVNIIYQRRILQAQFLKSYNTLTKAVNISSTMNGSIGSWVLDTSNPDIIISDYIKPYVNIASEKEVQPYTIKDLKVSIIGALNNYVANHTGGGTIQYFIVDGSSIIVNEINNDGAVILLDTNGVKTPNIIGRDIFFLLIRKSDGQVVPNVPVGDNNANCGGTPDGGITPGEGCAARILAEGKMNY